MSEEAKVETPEPEAKERSAHPHLATEALFGAYANQFMQTDLVDRGRSLQSRSRLDGGMKIRLTPVESRHESVLRPLVNQVASIVNRLRVIEEALGIDYQKLQDAANDSPAPSESAEPTENASGAERSGAVSSAEAGSTGEDQEKGPKSTLEA